MTKRLGCALTILLCVAPASGQLPEQTPVSAADSVRADFARRLLLAIDLADGQRDSLQRLRARLQEELDVVQGQVESGTLQAAEGRLHYRESIQAYRTARDAILTASQLELIDRARVYRREQRIDDGLDDGPQRLVTALQLTQEQRRRWLALLARLRQEVRSTGDRGAPPTPTDYLRWREQYRIAFEAILTPEQRLELERYKQEQERRRLEQERAERDMLEAYGVAPDSTIDPTTEPTLER